MKQRKIMSVLLMIAMISTMVLFASMNVSAAGVEGDDATITSLTGTGLVDEIGTVGIVGTANYVLRMNLGDDDVTITVAATEDDGSSGTQWPGVSVVAASGTIGTATVSGTITEASPTFKISAVAAGTSIVTVTPTGTSPGGGTPVPKTIEVIVYDDVTTDNDQGTITAGTSGNTRKDTVNIAFGAGELDPTEIEFEAYETNPADQTEMWPTEVKAKFISGSDVISLKQENGTAIATTGETTILAGTPSATPHPANTFTVKPLKVGKAVIEITSKNGMGRAQVTTLTINVKAAPKAGLLSKPAATGSHTLLPTDVSDAAGSGSTKWITTDSAGTGSGSGTNDLIYGVTDTEVKDLTVISAPVSNDGTFTPAGTIIKNLEVGQWLTVYETDDATGKVVRYRSVEIELKHLRNEQQDPTFTYTGKFSGKGTEKDPIVYDLKNADDLEFTIDFGLTGEGEYKYDDLTTNGSKFAIADKAAAAVTNFKINKSGELIVKKAYLSALEVDSELYELKLTFAIPAVGSDPTVAANALEDIIIYVKVADSSGYVIKGTVSGASPIAKAKVQLVNSNGKPVGEPVYTKDDGTYEIKAVTSTDPKENTTDTYTLLVGAAGYIDNSITGFPVYYTATGVSNGILTGKDVTLTAITTAPGAAGDVIVYSDTWDSGNLSKGRKLYINLTDETIDLSGLEVTAYSVDGGSKWKTMGKKTFDDAAFAKLLTKQMTLVVTNGTIDKKTKKPVAGSEIVTFQAIAARPKLAKFAVNYAATDSTGATALVDRWTLTAAGSKKELTSFEIAKPSDSNPKLPGKFSGLSGGVAVSPEGSAKEVYFVRKPAEPGTSTSAPIPASLSKKVSISSELKAPNLKIKSGTIKYKANTYIKVDSGAAQLFTAAGEFTVPASGKTVEIWTAPTAKKPKSAVQSIDVVPAS